MSIEAQIEVVVYAVLSETYVHRGTNRSCSLRRSPFSMVHVLECLCQKDSIPMKIIFCYVHSCTGIQIPNLKFSKPKPIVFHFKI